MSRTSPSYHAASAAIYSNGQFVDGAADSPAIGCHFLLPHGSGAVRSRSNAIAASHTVHVRGHHFRALRAFLRFAIPERCTPTPWRRKRTMLHPYTTKRKEMRGAPRSLGVTLYSDCSSGAWPPLVPPRRHTTGPRTTAMATDTRAAAWLKNVQETSNAGAKRRRRQHRQQQQQALRDKRSNAPTDSKHVDDKNHSLTGNDLRQKLRQWLSPPDPSISYNTACCLHHKGTAGWFTKGPVFGGIRGLEGIRIPLVGPRNTYTPVPTLSRLVQGSLYYLQQQQQQALRDERPRQQHTRCMCEIVSTWPGGVPTHTMGKKKDDTASIHDKHKEMRGAPRSLGGNASRDSIILYSDHSCHHSGRDCDGNVLQCTAAGLKNVQESDNASAKRHGHGTHSPRPPAAAAVAGAGW
ncbi:hypothetical protein BJV78DRAFT_1158548 [Lactifluus subvellereus]|nr:hypothetical protein BJV78DRAFT_1158548 [Lactifluus subvellereus]